MSQRRLGVVVCRREIGVGDEGGDGFPVVENFARQRPCLGGGGILIQAAGPFQTGKNRGETPAFAFSATAWISPRSSRTSQAPKRAAS